MPLAPATPAGTFVGWAILGAAAPCLLAALLAACGGPAAQARDWPSAPFRGRAPTSPSTDPPCTCRGPNAAIEVGQETCLATPSGGRRSTCVLVLNNTSWQIGAQSCDPQQKLTN